MSDETENLVLEHLRHIRRKIDSLDERQDRMEMRLGAIERHLAGFHLSEATQNSDIDGIKERRARIERRLELNDS